MKYICIFALILPLTALISCIAISIFKDFTIANQTHCFVKNFLPSISATISNFHPQIALWRLLIGIDSFPRYLIAFIYYKNYYALKKDRVKYVYLYRVIVKAAFFFHFIELTSLLLLTYVSSTEIFSVHKLSFISFLASSTVYMFLTLLTHFWPERAFKTNHELLNLNTNLFKEYNDASVSFKDFKSRQLKLGTLIVYILCMIISLYFYIRHNLFCEAYIYSFFAFFEYAIVLTNICYHSIIFHDMELFKKKYKIGMFEKICKINND